MSVTIILDVQAKNSDKEEIPNISRETIPDTLNYDKY